MSDNTFFQKLRDIQKKERSTGALSEIEDTFYDDASNYLQDLLKIVDNNPLSLEAYQLRDAQRITIEICERREVKIITTAISNVQKAHDIFKGHKKDSELFDEVPYNVTPEEEKLYKDIINTIIQNREGLMKEIVPRRSKQETKIGFKPVTTRELSTKEKNLNTEKLIIEKKSSKEIKKSSKSTPPKLDENQIVMMFGQAPDDILLDENNEPIKQTKKTDITTHFVPPKPPKDGTVALQNTLKQESQKIIGEKPVQLEEELNKTSINLQKEVYSDEELVVFEKEITTDILDKDEKIYGPFEVKDMVLLPKSLVKVLKHNNVITIIR